MSKQIISNISDLAAAWGTTPELVERDLYKHTDCGAWISWTDATITIGSIVEGSDAEFDHTFCLPVEFDTIQAWIDELEALCDEAWHAANDDIEPEDYHWSLDSFGSGDIPEDADSVIATANELIDTFCEYNPYCGRDEIEYFSDQLWNHYCTTGEFPELNWEEA